MSARISISSFVQVFGSVFSCLLSFGWFNKLHLDWSNSSVCNYNKAENNTNRCRLEVIAACSQHSKTQYYSTVFLVYDKTRVAPEKSHHSAGSVAY